MSGECAGGGETGVRATVNALLALSNAEAADAAVVLNAQSLNATAVQLLSQAITKNDQAIDENASQVRKDLMQSALADLVAAKADLGSGTGFSFDLGAGNLMF